jgi:hypothetical protein
MHVRLLTGATRELVHEAAIPGFNEPPAVILWGSRVFVRDKLTAQLDANSTAGYTHEFLEVFAYTLVE